MKVEDWIRCNKCFRMLRESSHCFSVTQCQHIFCQRCVASEPLDKGTCPECKTDDVRLMTLKQPLDRTILAPFCRSLPEMMVAANQAAAFQRSQALIALRRYDQLETKYEQLKKSYARAERARKMINQKEQQLEQRIQQLERHLGKLHERASLSNNRRTNIFPTPSDSGPGSFFSPQNRRHDDFPAATEQLRPRSNRRPRTTPAFTPDRYSSRAVFSDDTSMTSANT